MSAPSKPVEKKKSNKRGPDKLTSFTMMEHSTEGGTVDLWWEGIPSFRKGFCKLRVKCTRLRRNKQEIIDLSI